MNNYVVIPTYNEKENIRDLLNLLRTLPVNVVIVDDNSPDGTAQIIANEYKEVYLLNRCSKQGIGSACKVGIKHALQDIYCQNVITSDADMSHNPVDILDLLDDDADVVIGSRYIKNGGIKGWNLYRKTTSRCANLMVKILLKTKVNDNTTNFRKYNREYAKLVTEVDGENYEWVISSLVQCIRKGAIVKEVPSVFVNRTLGKSKLKTDHILNWFKFIIKKAVNGSQLDYNNQ